LEFYVLQNSIYKMFC